MNKTTHADHEGGDRISGLRNILLGYVSKLALPFPFRHKIGLLGASLRIPKHGKADVPMLDGRIVGGSATVIQNFPYQLSLQYYGQHICGASILSPVVALTAAHCTDG